MRQKTLVLTCLLGLTQPATAAGAKPSSDADLISFTGRYELASQDLLIPSAVDDRAVSCAPTLRIRILRGTTNLLLEPKPVQTVGREYPTDWVRDVDAGRQCEEKNSSHIFGGWYCRKTALLSHVIETRFCQSYSRFAGKCFPDEEPVRLELLQDGGLLYDAQCIGYCPQRIVCRYRRAIDQS